MVAGLNTAGLQPQRFLYRRNRLIEAPRLSQRYAEAEIEVGAFRREGDRVPDRRLSGLDLARMHQGPPELGMTVRVTRLDLERLPLNRNGIEGSTLLDQKAGQSVVSGDGLGVSGDPFAQRGLGGGWLAALERKVGEMRAEIGSVRIQTHRLPQCEDRLFEPVRSAQDVAQIGMEYRSVGRHRDGASDCLFGRREIPRPHQHMAELSLPIGVSRLDLNRLQTHRDRFGMSALGAEHMTKLAVGMGEP